MKNLLLRQFDRLAKRASRVMLHKMGDSFDIVETANLRAAFESSEFYEKHLLTATTFKTDLEVLDFAIDQVTVAGGLFLEFGVASGRTISHIASRIGDRQVFGFDSFEGLPEDWRTGYPKGQFAGKLPEVPANAVLVDGWFSDTLPRFLAEHRGPVSFLHVDCDLYSSTAYLLGQLEDRIVPGTVVVFDELINYPGWKDHEIKALDEFVSRTGKHFIYTHFNQRAQQVGIRFT